MSTDLDDQLSAALHAAADTVTISAHARQEADDRRAPAQGRRPVYAVAASAAAVAAVLAATSLAADHRAAPVTASVPSATALFATPLPLSGGAALLQPCLKQERTVPPQASPVAAARSDRWTIDAVFEIHPGPTQASYEIGPDNKEKLRLHPREDPDTYPLVLAHAADGTRADCAVLHGSGFSPAPMSDPAYVPGYAQWVGGMGDELFWGTYAQGVARVTVTLGGREREARLYRGYFAAVGAPDPAEVGVPKERPARFGQVVTAYSSDGSVLSREDQSESAVVARHECWRRPDGTPLRVDKNVAAYATGAVSPTCGVALPLGR